MLEEVVEDMDLDLPIDYHLALIDRHIGYQEPLFLDYLHNKHLLFLDINHHIQIYHMVHINLILFALHISFLLLVLQDDIHSYYMSKGSDSFLFQDLCI